jgi:hypothetical protein
MSALGQEQTLHRSNVMSALPPKADMTERDLDVCFVPIADIVRPIRSPRQRGQVLPAEL